MNCVYVKGHDTHPKGGEPELCICNNTRQQAWLTTHICHMRICTTPGSASVFLRYEVDALPTGTSSMGVFAILERVTCKHTIHKIVRMTSERACGCISQGRNSWQCPFHSSLRFLFCRDCARFFLRQRGAWSEYHKSLQVAFCIMCHKPMFSH